MQDGRATARAAGVTAGDLDTGARIGRYVIIERVGLGAMGVVYGAYDPELDRKVALKFLKPGHQGVTETAKARLIREAKAMARLSHPNVVAVHDVGVFEDQVFLAMEFLSGGTIKSWLATKPRSWREILAVFVAAGRGLVAAHTAGLVHRDFKPDNVLLDKDGRPRVVDFGIAREAAGGTDSEDAEAETAQAANDAPTERMRESSGNNRPLLTLTKTGAMIGTPAYMAPEQFMGERGDEKSDQFSFCVALYEALYGERPFAGDDLLTISVNVTQETMRPLPKDRGVPTWIRRVITKGVKLNPEARWPSMAALIAALEDDPAVKLRRRTIAVGTIAVVAASLLVARQMVMRRHVEAELEISRSLEEAKHAAEAARAKVAEARGLRQRAYAAFDGFDREGGESSWRRTRALLPAIDDGYDKAERAFDNAFMLDRSRTEIEGELAGLRYEHLLFAEEFRMESRAQVLAERLAAADADGARRQQLAAPGSLALRTTPVAARVVLERFDRDPMTGRRTARSVAGPDVARSTVSLPAGSYRILLDGPGLAHVVYPFEVRRQQSVSVDLSLPSAASVPDGFVYVPAGDFWYGDADEQLRIQFLDTAPIHRRTTGAYLIAKTETTFAQWIAFLEALPPAGRQKRLPDVSTAPRGWLRLQRLDTDWHLAFQPATTHYAARLGEPVTYLGRKALRRQDWSQFPVTGITVDDVNAYLVWLRATGRVPGARLCTELEWERAARGGDDRLFPHGDELEPDDANFDLTYGRVDSAYGPDVVGSHPGSRSPFGVDDLAGNVLELVTSSAKPNELVIRGGAYFFGSASARSTNRLPVASTFRDVTTGIRVCAAAPGEQ